MSNKYKLPCGKLVVNNQTTLGCLNNPHNVDLEKGLIMVGALMADLKLDDIIEYYNAKHGIDISITYQVASGLISKQPMPFIKPDDMLKLCALSDSKYRPIVEEFILDRVIPFINANKIKHDDFKENTIMPNIITTNEPLTMSSLEIAELCDKQHKDVMRDIKNMLEQLEINSAQFCAQYKTKDGRMQPCFKLDKELSTTLVAGYNVKLRHKIIKRWQELENQTATPALPSNYKEALLALVAKEEQTEKLAIELKAKEQILEQAKPMIGFAETAQKADKGILIRDLAYLAQNDGIKIGEKRLWDLFRTLGFIHKKSTRPIQEYIERGYFVMQPTFVHHNSGMQEHLTTKVTGKGQIYFLQKLKEFFNIGGNNEPNNTLPV